MRSRLVCFVLVAACHSTPSAKSPIDLDQELAHQSRGLYACLARAAAERPDFAGHLDAQVAIDVGGYVVDVRVTASTFPDDGAVPCLMRVWSDMHVSPGRDAVVPVRLAWENDCGATLPPDGTGTMDKDLIRRVIGGHLDEVRACYEAELAKNNTLQGRVVLQFTVAHEGNVVDAHMQSAALGDGRVDACIVAVAHAWRFPPTCGGTVAVSYPFVLKPESAH